MESKYSIRAADDRELFTELARLTKEGYNQFKELGLIGS
jgi:hypothetical protein